MVVRCSVFCAQYAKSTGKKTVRKREVNQLKFKFNH